MRPLVRQTSSSPYIFPYVSKKRAGLDIACTATYQATLGMFSAHSTHVRCLAAYRMSVMLHHRFRAQHCEKNTVCRERGQRAHTGENRNLHLLELCDMDGGVPEPSLGYLEDSKA